jgi:hypothetical protein
VDTVTAHVVRELRADGVRPLLLKGPVLESLLYGDDSTRAYVDSDLLVGPSEYAAAECTLARLGFQLTLTDSDVPGSQVAGHPWFRSGDGACIDLHWTIAGVRATPVELWEAASQSTRTIAVANVDVEAPYVPMCALIVALHAGHHGRAVAKPLEDLARALERFDFDTWAAAARLGERLAAAEVMASGLTRNAAGRRLAAQLSLPVSLPPELLLRAADPPPGAVTLEVLASTEGLRAKLWLVARKVVPTRRFMQVWFPRSARGGRWMFAAYLWRALWLVLKVGPASRAWRRARNS